MSFQDMEIKTEIVEDQKTLDIFASYDENRPTQSDLNKDLLIVPDLNESEQSEDRNDVMDISIGTSVFKLKAKGMIFKIKIVHFPEFCRVIF